MPGRYRVNLLARTGALRRSRAQAPRQSCATFLYTASLQGPVVDEGSVLSEALGCGAAWSNRDHSSGVASW
jgi:hypothetical protein